MRLNITFISYLHPNISKWEKVGYYKRMCPVAEKICQHILNLPTHAKINEREILRIVKMIS